MSDRELLEAAAKAAGLEFKWEELRGGAGNVGGYARARQPGADAFPIWRPLTDDGDALRLAVALRMCVEPWGSGAAAVVSIDNRAICAEPHYGDDPERATRRAIVRAAAALAPSA